MVKDTAEQAVQSEDEVLEGKIRFWRFPEWKFPGLQLLFYFGKLPDPRFPAHLMAGWRTFLFWIFKVTSLPEDSQAEITSDNIKGFIMQGQIWLPFDFFGKL